MGVIDQLVETYIQNNFHLLTLLLVKLVEKLSS